MASVYRRTRRKPIPSGAEIVEARGRRSAVWTSRGRRQRAPLSDDAQAVMVQDDNYTVEWFDWQGKRRRTSGGPDKDAAEALGAKLEAEEMQRRRGLIDPKQERLVGEGRRPLGEHLADFKAKMEAADRDPKAMPPKEDVAEMLRGDLAGARREWWKAAQSDPEESVRRRESDFLTPVNHEGEALDFHALRHPCGAWLAMSGAHPKAVQAVMRHSTITLTMDTYWHRR